MLLGVPVAVMLLIRFCVVSPQLAAQLCQSAQSLHTQSTGPAMASPPIKLFNRQARVGNLDMQGLKWFLSNDLAESRSRFKYSKQKEQVNLIIPLQGSNSLWVLWTVYHKMICQQLEYVGIWEAHRSTQIQYRPRCKSHLDCRNVSRWDSDMQHHQMPCQWQVGQKTHTVQPQRIDNLQ